MNAYHRRPSPMDAEGVREIISTMERETKSLAARKAMARAAVKLANVTDEGRQVWLEYARRIGA